MKKYGQPYNFNNILLKYIVNLYHIDMNGYSSDDINNILSPYPASEYDELDLLNASVDAHHYITLLTVGSNCADDAIRYVVKPYSRTEILNNYDGVHTLFVLPLEQVE
ncbi:hypothetical protein [Methanospirillum sp.]|uniref:hypothetical protein n=1 Tax=Methanospirillum sp. TaxID=45200 RepID=UPI002CA07851|nr:hypothetical protein [Methanospirillum sp.]HPP79227.1 hypothetical protein [Methanospirillum sp.]